MREPHMAELSQSTINNPGILTLQPITAQNSSKMEHSEIFRNLSTQSADGLKSAFDQFPQASATGRCMG